MNSPIAPESPTSPYWPISCGIDWLDQDFERQHADYIESP